MLIFGYTPRFLDAAGPRNSLSLTRCLDRGAVAESSGERGGGGNEGNVWLVAGTPNPKAACEPTRQVPEYGR